MGNRVLEAKRLKMRKQRKNDPTKYNNGYIPVGKAPNREVMSQYKSSAKSLAFDETFMDGLKAKVRQARKGKDVIPPGRLEARQKYLESIEKLMTFELPALQFFVLDITPNHEYRLCFNDRHTIWIIHHFDVRRNAVRRSISYPSKSIAVGKFERDRVSWKLDG